MADTRLAQHNKHVEENGGARFKILNLPIKPEDFKTVVSNGISGYLYVEMCEECGIVNRAECECLDVDGLSTMQWNKKGTKLECVVCGRDGT